MKTKVIFMTALLLAPTAGAAAVQADPAQNFRVSYTKAAPATAPGVFTKANLPQVISDEELDEVTGEVIPLVPLLIGGAMGGAGWYVGEKVINYFFK